MNREELVKTLLEKKNYQFNDLLLIMKLLRAEDGCAWDREQTHGSLRACMIEEAYEVVEAIDREDAELLREELGDVLFQVVFHAQIEDEAAGFCIDDVVQEICEKMIRRHPHVFAQDTAENADAVVEKWESIKKEEKQRTTLSSRLRAVPTVLPALMRGEKVASKIGFSAAETQVDMAGRVQELARNLVDRDPQELAGAVGELLYSIVTFCAFCGVDAEHALGQAVQNAILQAENEEKCEKTEKNDQNI